MVAIAITVGGSTHPDTSWVDDEATLRDVLRPEFDTIRDDLPPLFMLRRADHGRGGPAMLVGVSKDRSVL